MKFTRLRLTGFKSFCDPTELYLEPGLSGVVGPNGCGKSNLVEALRWVMGESSYKAMRASGMDDVIFSGSGSRPGRNTAEVTLVLDNSDRTAPQPLNTADVLEVTRRIEREAGSVYRVNGKEVRARDVQLLFADASTGAHSPALVRQGQIGELIAAKPQQRRALLEEAAGISGLHSRRHEAELRLRAAEQNLERVDDIIGQVEQQLETLKRQARLAVRYRALSGDIRKAEATLFHIRWVAARFAERDAEAAQAKLVRQLADAQHVELEAQKVLFVADKALQPLREADAAAGAALQRLTIAAEQLESEARRASARQRELGERLKQIEQDANRERQLVAEGDEALTASQAEILRLESEAAGELAASEAARQAAEAARLEVATAEAEARTAADALAQLRARRAAAERALEEARQRVSRADAQLAEVVREAAQVAARLDADETLTLRRAALANAQAKTADAEQRALAAEAAAGAAQQAADAVRPELQQLDGQVNRLDAEAQTLTRVLDSGGKRRWPPVVDQLRVTPGYERALGAALGEDLEASSDAAAPLHWTTIAPDDDPALPDGVEPLSSFVTGSDLLTRRLRQIGVVDAGEAPRLQAALRAGQRLVGKTGGLWRWDGFVAAADAPTAAAERLRQRNRLAEVQAELEEVRARRNARRADATALGEALTSSRNAERLARDAWRLAQREIGLAQAEVDKAQRAMGELATRQSALEEARTRLETGLAEARAAEAQAIAAAGGAADEGDAQALVNEKQAQLGRLRERAEQARLKLGTFETAARMRQARLNQLGTERAAWQRRRDGAAAQLETLATRSTEIAAELAKGESTPESYIEKRRALDAEIANARATRATSADALSTAESRHREADRAQRHAADALAGFRAETARMEERIKGLEAAREQIERLVLEQLNILASQTAQAAGLRPEQALPNEKQVETQLDRLKAERERLGGVNLGAEREAEEVREKLDLMVKDRDDLIAAIGKLRAGIQSLNREGRQRLSEAFDKVNARFQELFTSLFGGGTAELQFVESEDPLEAGLEIIARPPGKKPSTMTLLSGGEQALTAMSLIFAVFLTNPAPICVLDEVDAPLDDANVERFCNLLDMMAERTHTRFLVITHNPITMSRVDRLFGVTMMERGVSQLVSVDLSGAQRVVAAAE
jgi:chromosome segregation protein